MMIAMALTVLQANRNGSMTDARTSYLELCWALARTGGYSATPPIQCTNVLTPHSVKHHSCTANTITTTFNGNLRQPLQTLFKTEKLGNKLSDLKTNIIHMCKNLYCSFDGPFAKVTTAHSANMLGEIKRHYHTKYFNQYHLHHASRPWTPTPTWPKHGNVLLCQLSWAWPPGKCWKY